MDVQMELALDSDAFLRRECPHCEQEFKWHHGPTDSAPETFVYSEVYWCPRCSRSAAKDAWWTQAQFVYQQEYVAAIAPDIMSDALQQAFDRNRNRGFTFTPGPRVGEVDAPAPPAEPDDMEMIAPPCHP